MPLEPLAPTPVDRFLHKVAREARNQAEYQGYLLLFHGAPPSVERVRHHVAETAPRVPVWAYRITERRGRPAWEAGDRFEPRAHVHELLLPPGPDPVGRMTRELLRLPFPDDARDWGVWLVHGWAPDAYALCYRVHHALQDGMGGATAVGALFGPGDRALPLTVPADAEPPLKARELVAMLGADIPAAARRTAHWTPASRAPDEHRTLHRTHVEVERLRTLGKAAGATLNQVYLAATAGALRAWSPGDWPPSARPLHAFMPLDTRPAGWEQTTLGNHMAMLRVPLPCGEPDPRRRLESLVRTARTTPERRAATRAGLRVLPRTGAALIRYFFGPRRTALTVTNIRVPGGMTFDGDPVTASIGLPALLLDHPLMVGLSSYGPEATVVFISDRADPDPALLPELWQRALTELEDACSC
ncbi:wax ester/triacylglycerol synthase domain-containing protein [Streptomyces sp. NPDC005492]|uniref:wax ester/triacylglycerol synthase domain-containing protein n=1 Tax=Streptomyces sp. NPDC005492 TaxID=3156883 RepID=UPI0033ADFD7D